MASTPPRAKVDVGRVLSRGFGALKPNFLPYLAISLVLAGVPGFLTQYWVLSNFDLADPRFIASPLYWGWFGASILVSIVASALLQGVLVRSTILQLSGRDPDPWASALLALRLLLPLIGLSLVLAVLMGIGFVLLIVPGVMIYCATIVAVPALIEERRGVFASIARSRALTRGSRWHVFLLVVLFWILATIVQNFVALFSGVTMFSVTQPTLPDPALAGIAAGAGASVTTMIVAVVLAALYVELREVKEGATTNELADVFG